MYGKKLLSLALALLMCLASGCNGESGGKETPQPSDSAYYVRDGYASKTEYPLNVNSISYASSCIQNICSTYLTEDTKVYLSVIPDKNYFLADGTDIPKLDYAAMLAQLQSENEGLKYIDIFPALSLEAYYKTDPHWRQEKLQAAADLLADGMGTVLSDEYTVTEAETPYCGAYFGKTGETLEGEPLYYLESELLSKCTVYNYETSETTGIYDMQLLGGDDPYEVFLSGPRSLLTVENPSAETEKELIIFRDSFGSSLAPLLVSGYSKITLVDIRYISSAVLGRFIDFNGQDVLFIYSTLVLNNSSTMKL